MRNRGDQSPFSYSTHGDLEGQVGDAFENAQLRATTESILGGAGLAEVAAEAVAEQAETLLPAEINAWAQAELTVANEGWAKFDLADTPPQPPNLAEFMQTDNGIETLRFLYESKLV